MLKHLVGLITSDLISGCTEHQGTYLVNLKEDVDLSHVPIRREIIISGNTISVSYGKVTVYAEMIFFRVAEEETTAFHFSKSELLSVTTEDGSVIWGNS